MFQCIPLGKSFAIIPGDFFQLINSASAMRCISSDIFADETLFSPQRRQIRISQWKAGKSQGGQAGHNKNKIISKIVNEKHPVNTKKCRLSVIFIVTHSLNTWEISEIKHPTINTQENWQQQTYCTHQKLESSGDINSDTLTKNLGAFPIANTLQTYGRLQAIFIVTHLPQFNTSGYIYSDPSTPRKQLVSGGYFHSDTLATTSNQITSKMISLLLKMYIYIYIHIYHYTMTDTNTRPKDITPNEESHHHNINSQQQALDIDR